MALSEYQTLQDENRQLKQTIDALIRNATTLRKVNDEQSLEIAELKRENQILQEEVVRLKILVQQYRLQTQVIVVTLERRFGYH